MGGFFVDILWSYISFAGSSFSYVYEEYACKYEHTRKGNDPAQCSEPPDAVDVKEKIGEPWVASNQVACVDEGDI